MKLVLLLVTLLISLPANASTWLCIGEHLAQVKHTDGEVLGSESSRNDQKVLVSEKGVQFFGEDNFFLDSCTIKDDVPSILCVEADSPIFGHLAMDLNRLFTLVGLYFDDDKSLVHYIVKGKCSKIGD